MSLPIPENPNHNGVVTTFEMLRGKQARNIPAAIEQLRPRFDLTQSVHLDPDIRPQLRPRNQLNAKCYYGQNGSFQTTLHKGGVCDPNNHSLFLFYGWYRGVEENTGTLGYIRTKPNERLSQNQHVIWGWLQVETPHLIAPEQVLPSELADADHHPHVENRDRINNCIYVGRDWLTFEKDKAGAGIFSHYHPDLRLTCPNERNKMSSWRVPPFLRNAATGGVYTQWRKQRPDASSLFYRGPGQEFVFNTEHHETETSEWLTKLFSHA